MIAVTHQPDFDLLWRQHSRKVLATLIRLLRDFDLAEDALHEAFLAAAQKWPNTGVPANPSAWLVSAGRFRAIDRMRRSGRFATAQGDLAVLTDEAAETGNDGEPEDDQLRLIFACCHPALPPEWQVALTLRTVCGLTTEEIARAFLVRTPTMAQRIVRAKQRIKSEGLQYEIPAPVDLAGRLDPVLRVVYLVFNEGYSAASGPDMLRTDMSGEAIRLGRLLAELLPEAEVLGLLGLMLLHDARKDARLSPAGEVVLLDDQDRALWDKGLIAEGLALVERAFAGGQVGAYALQGAIAALHVTAPAQDETHWAEILGLYTVLDRVAPSPVVRLNRAIAIGKVRGPENALREIEALLAGTALADYHLAYLAQAEMLRQLGRMTEALFALNKALALCKLDPERRALARRIADLDKVEHSNR